MMADGFTQAPSSVMSQPLETSKQTDERYLIRPIRPEDNPAIAQVILAGLEEFGCVGKGFAHSDPEVHCMYETFQAPADALNSRYWVVEDTQAIGQTGQILGGGGYIQLGGTTPDEAICELQKLYFSPVLRGLGLGRHVLELALQWAPRDGYRVMYLESMPQMSQARALYEKQGFVYLPEPLGNTGHFNCQTYMSRAL